MTRKTARDIKGFKGKDTPMVCLTASIAPVASIADDHADLLLVGDSLGMVLYGFDSTLPVTLEMMAAHGKAVVRSSDKAFVVVDMPFGSYQESPEQAFRNAAWLMSETGCGAVKLEGGLEMAATVEFLTLRGVPVIGHIGLQPQSVNMAGGYRVTGREDIEAKRITAAAGALEAAGALAVVLECIDEVLAKQISACTIPTIGIGASVHCDGQILVTEDILGLTSGPLPRFVKQYGELASSVHTSLAAYARDVRARKFPGEDHIYRVVRDLSRVKA